MATTAPWVSEKPTALLVLADGTVIEGRGLGATGEAVAEVCFNTALTGYQEILTDPSYAGQIVTFTFPHIGNIGTNDEDVEDLVAQRLALHLELVEERPEHVAFAGVHRDEVPQVTDVPLTNAVNPSEALLEPVRVPRDVVVDHQVGSLEVHALTGRVGGQQN